MYVDRKDKILHGSVATWQAIKNPCDGAMHHGPLSLCHTTVAVLRLCHSRQRFWNTLTLWRWRTSRENHGDDSVVSFCPVIETSYMNVISSVVLKYLTFRMIGNLCNLKYNKNRFIVYGWWTSCQKFNTSCSERIVFEHSSVVVHVHVVTFSVR